MVLMSSFARVYVKEAALIDWIRVNSRFYVVKLECSIKVRKS